MKKTSLKIKPEAMKPGLNVMVDWYSDGSTFYPAKLIKKLRKNWGVKLNKAGEICNASIPYEAMTIDTGYAEGGRKLMATKEDEAYHISQKHTDWLMSLVIKPEGVPREAIKHTGIKELSTGGANA
tara:strand:+ start:1604 stop:1981 length:378 start_codon:yes stop_codon:yes gene_type:complete